MSSSTTIIWQQFNNASQWQVPKGWRICQLSDVVEEIIDFRGRTPLKIGMIWGGGDIPALSANNVEMGRINLKKETYYGSEALYKKWMNKGGAEKGDILLTMEAPLGNVAQIPDSQKYILSQRVILLKTKTALILNSFLKQYLMSDRFQALLKSYSTGTTATGIQQAKLLTLPVVIPSFLEQQKTAQILDTIDKLITLTDRHIAKLKQAKAGLLHDLLTLGINENGELRDPVEHPEQFKETGTAIGQIPQGWEIQSIKSLLEGRPKNGYSPKEVNEWTGKLMLGLGCLTPEGLQLCQLKNAPAQDPRIDAALLKDGDFLISRSNTRELVALVEVFNDLGIPTIYPDLMMRLVPNQKITSYLLEVLMRHHPVRQQLTSAAQGTSGSMVKINSETVLKTIAAVPSSEEQARILKCINGYNHRIRAKNARLEKLKLLKKGLMTDLLTGRVRVTLDPIEEG